MDSNNDANNIPIVELIFVPKHACNTISSSVRIDSITIVFSSGIISKFNSEIILFENFTEPFFTFVRSCPTLFAVA